MIRRASPLWSWLPCLIAAALTLSAWAAFEVGMRAKLTDDVNRRVQRMADLFARQVTAGTQHRDAEVRTLARVLAAGGADAHGAREELESARRMAPRLVWLGATDAKGQIIAATDRFLEGKSLADRPEFQRAVAESWMSDVHPAADVAAGLANSEGDPLELVGHSAPIRRPDGSLQGVLVAWSDWQAVRDMVQRTLAVSPEMQWALLASDGRPLISTPSLPASTAWRKRGAAGLERASQNGDGWLVARTSLTQGPAAAHSWQVVMAESEAAVLVPMRSVERPLLVGGSATTALLALFGAWRTRRDSARFSSIAHAVVGSAGASQAPESDLFTPALTRAAKELDLLPPGEVDRLAREADATEQALVRVAEDGERLRKLLTQCPIAMTVIDEQLRLAWWNPACEALFGFTSEEAVGCTPQELFALTRWETGECDVSAGLQRRLRQPRTTRMPLRRRDGSDVWIECQSVPLRYSDGRRGGFLALMRDLSEERRAQAQAREAEQRLAVLVGAAVDLVLARLDAAGNVTQWSSSAEALFGIPAPRMVGRAIEVLFPLDELDSGVPRSLIQRAHSVGRVEHEGYLLRHGSDRFWANLLIYRLDESGDTPAGFAMVARDLSERRATEERLQQSEATLAAIIDNASDAVISTDVLGRVMLFNPAAERIFGIGASDMIGRTFERLLPARHRAGHELHLARFATSTTPSRPMGRRGKLVGLRADGTELQLEASISQTVVRSRKVLTAILRDVSDRVKAEQDLIEHQQQLSALTQRLMGTEQETNRRLAQVLHDQLGQTLTAMRLAFDALQASCPADDLRHAPAEALRQRLSELIDRSVSEVRQVLVDLRPALLQEMGLSAAIDNEVRNQGKEAPGMKLAFEPDADLQERRWHPDTEYAVFMIAREAVGNAIRHAGASEVHVMLTHGTMDGSFVLSVQDDGSGIGADAQAVKPGHLGLVGMRERALAIDGTMRVESSADHGTTITLEWRDTSS